VTIITYDCATGVKINFVNDFRDCFSGTVESPLENATGRFREASEEEKDDGDVHRGGGHAPVQAGEADCVPVAARVLPRRGRQRR